MKSSATHAGRTPAGRWTGVETRRGRNGSARRRDRTRGRVTRWRPRAGRSFSRLRPRGSRGRPAWHRCAGARVEPAEFSPVGEIASGVVGDGPRTLRGSVQWDRLDDVRERRESDRRRDLRDSVGLRVLHAA